MIVHAIRQGWNQNYQRTPPARVVVDLEAKDPTCICHMKACMLSYFFLSFLFAFFYRCASFSSTPSCDMPPPLRAVVYKHGVHIQGMHIVLDPMILCSK